MSTRLYLRHTQANAIGVNYYDLSTSKGAAGYSVGVAVPAALGGWSYNRAWASYPVAVAFTLTSTDVQFYAVHSVASSNIVQRYFVYKRVPGGTETHIGTFNDDIHLTTAIQNCTWTGNVTDMAFAVGDRIVIRAGVVTPGTDPELDVAAAGTATLYYNGATYPSFLTLAQNVEFTVPTIAACVTDSPTNFGEDTGLGGEVRGNYCTWNSLDKSGSMTVADGNLRATNGAASYLSARSSMTIPRTGKWYAELNNPTQGTGAANVICFALANALAPWSGNIHNTANSWAIIASNIGALWSQTTQLSNTLGTFPANTILKLAIDSDNNRAWAGKNADWYNNTGDVGNPTAGTGPTFTGLPKDLFLMAACWAMTGYLNCGQRPWRYPAPTGFKAICSANLPTPPAVILPATFTGNAGTNGPFVNAWGVVETVTINGNVATRNTHFDRVSNGIKLRTTSALYNASGTNTITAATYGVAHKIARGQSNP